MRVCAYMVFLSVCPGESTWPVSWVHRRNVYGNEETPLLTSHQLVSGSSPGLTSCRYTGFVEGFSVVTAQLSHAGRSSLG